MATHHTDEKKPALGRLICHKVHLFQKSFHKVVLGEAHLRLAGNACNWGSPSILLIKVTLACNLVVGYGLHHASAAESTNHGQNAINISLSQGTMGTIADSGGNRLEFSDSPISVIPTQREAMAEDDAESKGDDGRNGSVFRKNLSYHYLFLELFVYFILGMICGSGLLYPKRRDGDQFK